MAGERDLRRKAVAVEADWASVLTTIAEKESKASKALYRAFRISGVMGGSREKSACAD